jgi:hypothetical protein
VGPGRRRGQPGIDGRSSATGPGTIGLYYSGDGVTAALATFNQAPGANFVNSVVDLDSLPGLAGTVEFRLRQVGLAALGAVRRRRGRGLKTPCCVPISGRALTPRTGAAAA